MGSLWPDRLVWNKHRLRRCSMTIEYQTYGLVFYGHRTPAAPVFILHKTLDVLNSKLVEGLYVNHNVRGQTKYDPT